MGASETSSGGSAGASGAGSAIADDDAKMVIDERADQLCWTIFSSTMLLVASLFAVLVFSLWESPPPGHSIRAHSLEYILYCMLGGVLSGLPHTLLTPVDHLKCRVQCGEFSSFSDGFRTLWADGRAKGWSELVALFFRGWVPTLVGYSLQGALKFGLYEFFKHYYAGVVGHELAVEHQVALFLVSSATAEVIADCALSPWEAVKIKMQTTRLYPPIVRIVVPRMYALEGFHGFFKGLAPLWMRQVPYTMVKFATFEKIVQVWYIVVFTQGKCHVSPGTQLLVSVCSGFMSGVICALVSHPADTLVSKLNQKSDGRSGAWSVLVELGCAGIWKGLSLRLFMIGTLTALQWLIYDSFKVMVGLGTTGGGHACGIKAAMHHHSTHAPPSGA